MPSFNIQNVRSYRIELHRLTRNPQATFVFLLLGITIALAGLQVGFSQFIPCGVIINSLRYPDSVPAGQSVQVLTTVTSSCYPSTPYAIRVDLLDGTTLRVLSSATIPYNSTSPSFVAYPVVNEVTAPSSSGPWVLQLQAYVVGVLSGQVVASTSDQFNINVTPYTPPSATTVITTTRTAVTTTATSLSQTFSSSTSTRQVILLNSTSTFLPIITQNTDMTSTLLIAAAVTAVLIGAIIVIAVERRRNTVVSKTQGTAKANFCGHCGTELKRNEAFCGNCGAPLKLQKPD